MAEVLRENGLSHEDRLLLYSKITRRRFDLGRHLKLPVEDINRLREEFRLDRNVENSVADIILKWEQRFGDDATRTEMLDALLKIGRRDLVDKLQKSETEATTRPRAPRPSRKPPPHSIVKQPSIDIETEEKKSVLAACRDKSVSFVNVHGTVGSGKTFLLDSVYRTLTKSCSVAMLAEYRFRNVKKLSSDIVEKLQSVSSTSNYSSPNKIFQKTDDVTRCIQKLTDKSTLVIIVDLHSYHLGSSSGDTDLLNMMKSIVKTDCKKNFTFLISSNSSLVRESSLGDFKDNICEVHLKGFDHQRSKDFLMKVGVDALPDNCIDVLCQQLGNLPRTLKLACEIDFYSILKLPVQVPHPNLLYHHFYLNGRDLFREISSTSELTNSVRELLSMSMEKRTILITSLVFPSSFYVAELKLVLGDNVKVSESDLRRLPLLRTCEETGSASSNCFDHDPTLREALIAIIHEKENDPGQQIFTDGCKKFYGLMIHFIEFLGTCYLGTITEDDRFDLQRQAIKFEKFFISPYPIDQLESNLRSKWVISHFRHHRKNMEEAIVEGCKFPGLVEDILRVVTETPTYHLIGKIMLYHQHSRIYTAMRLYLRPLPAIPVYYISLAKLEVAMGYFLINLHGFKNYCKEAEDLLLNAQKIYEHLVDWQAEGLAIPYCNCLTNLGRCIALKQIKAEIAGGYERGIDLIDEANEILKKQDSNWMMCNLLILINDYHSAGILYLAKNFNRARKRLKETSQSFQNVLPTLHPLQASIEHRLACVQIAISHNHPKLFHGAFRYLRSALEMRLRVYGDHPESLRTLTTIAYWHEKNNDDIKKLEVLREAEQMFHRLRYDMPDAADLFEQLASVHKGKQKESYKNQAECLKAKFTELSSPTYFIINNDGEMDSIWMQQMIIALVVILLFLFALGGIMWDVGAVDYFLMTLQKQRKQLTMTV